VLTFLGLRILFKKRVEKPQKPPKLHHEFLNTFFLAMINPPTIFVFMQIFIIFHMIVDPDHKTIDITTVVGGIMLGSVSWWIAMAYIVGSFKKLVSGNFQKIISKASGVMMIVMAVIAVIGACRNF